MKISELLRTEAINSELKAKGKNEALAEMVDAMMKIQNGLDREEVIRVLLEREKLGSTGIGDGVAIPHGKLRGLKDLFISFGRSRGGVEFDSMDGKPVNLVFLLVAPEESVGVHLKTLARISKLLKNPAVRQRLVGASGSQEIYDIIVEEEEKL
ncbi:MAG: PTS sugar transporter subunit IIA [Desulfuromonadaceae bacterium]|nr:PTS sugar transporter subunit IIA [Desulfuromonadaceae bacterium]